MSSVFKTKAVERYIGTVRDPVTGSGSWPPCNSNVSGLNFVIVYLQMVIFYDGTGDEEDFLVENKTLFS